ncbi:MAG: ACT domain-containing protein [Magnetococcales bacterium]|nr:ACT domain-containing protein [Magnetococcales bacterium]
MNQFALLTLAGRDQPGIVAQVAKLLFETGCNIEDSSMTRLRGEFTIMLVLRLPEGLTTPLLEEKFTDIVRAMALNVTLQDLPGEETGPTPAPTDQETIGEECIISVLGADQPGIVYRVTQILEEEGGNIHDLHTQVAGASGRPVYSMVIEAEGLTDLTGLKERLDALGREIDVDVSVRAANVFEL